MDIYVEQFETTIQDFTEVPRVRFSAKDGDPRPLSFAEDVVSGFVQQRCRGRTGSEPERTCDKSSSVNFHIFVPNNFESPAQPKAKQTTARVAQSRISAGLATVQRRSIQGRVGRWKACRARRVQARLQGARRDSARRSSQSRLAVMKSLRGSPKSASKATAVASGCGANGDP